MEQFDLQSFIQQLCVYVGIGIMIWLSKKLGVDIKQTHEHHRTTHERIDKLHQQISNQGTDGSRNDDRV